jgi:hypothetical protein
MSGTEEEIRPEEWLETLEFLSDEDMLIGGSSVTSGDDFSGGVFSGGVFSGGVTSGDVFSSDDFSGGGTSFGGTSGGVFSFGVTSGGCTSGSETNGSSSSSKQASPDSGIKKELNVEEGVLAVKEQINRLSPEEPFEPEDLFAKLKDEGDRQQRYEIKPDFRKYVSSIFSEYFALPTRLRFSGTCVSEFTSLVNSAYGLQQPSQCERPTSISGKYKECFSFMIDVLGKMNDECDMSSEIPNLINDMSEMKLDLEDVRSDVDMLISQSPNNEEIFTVESDVKTDETSALSHAMEKLRQQLIEKFPGIIFSNLIETSYMENKLFEVSEPTYTRGHLDSARRKRYNILNKVTKGTAKVGTVASILCLGTPVAVAEAAAKATKVAVAKKGYKCSIYVKVTTFVEGGKRQREV